MSFRSIGSPETLDTYCCLGRAPVSGSSMLNRTFCEEVAVKTFTGIETSPKEIVPEEIARGAMNAMVGERRSGAEGNGEEGAFARRIPEQT